MIKKLFFPYHRELSVVFISNDEQNCIILNNLIHSVFDSNNSVLNHIGNIQYLKENSTFSFVINTSTTIRFSINNLVTDYISTDFFSYDILVPVFCLNKHSLYEYDSTITNTDYILKMLLKTNKPIIASYLNAEHLFENEIENEVKWQLANNELHKLVVDFAVEPIVSLTHQGKATMRGLFKIFNYYSKQQKEFSITRKVNFFSCNANEIIFGKNEFVANLLMQMLTFDKLNSYSFQII